MKKILVVDDELSICLLLQNFLSGNYEVIYKTDPREAMEWLETDLPDMIISDVQMPQMDGYAFLAHVRSRGFTRHTPFLMLSAISESKVRIKAYQLGAQDFLIKPFNPEELLEVVKKNLNPIHFAPAW